MSRTLNEFLNSAKWEMEVSEFFSVPRPAPGEHLPYQPLESRLYTMTSLAITVSVKSYTARETWKTGGWAKMLVQSPYNSDLIQIASRRLRLGSNLILFPNLAPVAYKLEVSFPFWLTDAALEIWKYIGTDDDDMEAIAQIQILMNNLSGKLDTL